MNLPFIGGIKTLRTLQTIPGFLHAVLRKLMITPESACGKCDQAVFTLRKRADVRLEILKDVDPEIPNN